VTVVDTLAPSYLEKTSRVAGSAADVAETRKCAKYQSLPATHEFIPLAFETLGSMGARTKEFVTDLCGRLRELSGDKRAGTYFLQRLSLELVRGNSLSVMGTMIGDDGYDMSMAFV